MNLKLGNIKHKRNTFEFAGKDGSHLPPKEVPDLNYAKLLKGCINVVEEDLE